jgi:thiopurine S-methyltransferase
MVDNQHWLDRWQENRIGFHEGEVNRHLQNQLPRFGLAPGSCVFMPLCGKAHDIAWIAQQGYEVIGIELSSIAIEAFFDEQELEYQRFDSDRFGVYEARNITLLQGDFFDLRNDDLGACQLVYDRAALIAMSPTNRPRYYEHMLSIIPVVGSMLLITLEYDQSEMEGPPFAVLSEEIYRYYEKHFSITLLQSEDIIDERPRWREAGLSTLSELVFRLDR